MKFFKLYYCCVIAILFILFNAKVEAKRILGLFPHFGYSHFKVFYPLMRNLAERGHNVSVISYIPSPDAKIDNYEELLLKGVDVVNIVSLDEMKPRTWKGLIEEYVALHEEGQQSCKRLYESGLIEKVLKQHKQQPYDLVITENFNSDCQLAVPYIMKTPIVALSSCLLMPWYYERILLPDTPSYVQSEFIGFPIPLNWYERLTNFVQAKALSLLYRYNTNYHDNRLIEHYLKIRVDVNTIAKQNTRIIFGNQHYSLMGIRPRTQQFLEIGGIHITKKALNSELPKKIDAFLENSNDVLFISWGSMIKASTMTLEKLQVILTVLKKLPMNVIWKWESDEVPVISDQFLFIKWAPQLTLLCHPKIKLFWSHGGLLGTTEGVYCGKPMLITPIYGDQFVNAFAVINRRIGRIVNYNQLSEKVLLEEFKHVLHQSYSTKSMEISKIFRDRQSKPLETATWWVEHVLNHERNSEVLHTHAVDLNWFVFYSLDSLSILLVCLVLSIFILKTFMNLTFSKVFKRGGKLKKS